MFKCLLISAAICLSFLQTQAQLSLVCNSYAVRDGALVLNVSIQNQSERELKIWIEKDKIKQQSNLALLQNRNEPATYVCFYNGDSLVSDIVPICDQSKDLLTEIVIKPQSFYLLPFETRCLSDNALLQLNSGKKTYARVFIFYKEESTIKQVASKRIKLRIKKNEKNNIPK